MVKDGFVFAKLSRVENTMTMGGGKFTTFISSSGRTSRYRKIQARCWSTFRKCGDLARRLLNSRQWSSTAGSSDLVSAHCD